MKHRFKQLVFNDWPEVDRFLWTEAQRKPASIWDDVNAASLWRKTSLKTNTVGYGIALGWLSETRQLVADMPPIDRWEDEVLSQYISELRDYLVPISARSYLLALM